MGNFASCHTSIVTDHKTAKLIDFNGGIHNIELPLTAVELMLDHPGHFISPADDLLRTLRYSAVKAEDEITGGKLYVLVPTSRVNAKASVKELGVVESACLRRRTKRRPSAKVLPAVVTEERENENGFGVLGGSNTGVAGCRLGVTYNRQWRPALEPIREV